MTTSMLTAIALLLATSACNRTAPANDAAAPVNAAANSAAPAPTPATPSNHALANAAAGQNNQNRMPIAPPMPEGCAGEIGVAEAEELVDQCIQVSPATRPPCNVANSCALIRDEIARGCGQLGDDAPDDCPTGG